MGKLSSSSLCLIVALACITMAATKRCYYCDITKMGNCVGIPMHCGEEENCYIGQGTATGRTSITNKGCVKASYCRRDQTLSYEGVTYDFITHCCIGNLCNTGSPGPKQAPPSFTAIITGLSLNLLLNWIL